MAFICLSVYLPIWAQKKSQKNREGNRRCHLKKTVLNCSNVYMHIRYGAKDITALGCDFFGSVTYTHIRIRRFAKFFPLHAKVSYAKVSYLRICYVKW